MDINLGNKVKDRMTGLEGFVSSFRTDANGNVAVGVQPKVDETGKLPEGYDFDKDQLEFVDEGIGECAKPRDPTVTIRPGEEVKSLDGSIVKGLVGHEVQFVNGCVYLKVFGVDKRGEPNSVFMPHAFFKKTGKGIAQPPKKKAAKPTGGPITISSRF